MCPGGVNLCANCRLLLPHKCFTRQFNWWEVNSSSDKEKQVFLPWPYLENFNFLNDNPLTAALPLLQYIALLGGRAAPPFGTLFEFSLPFEKQIDRFQKFIKTSFI